MADLNALESLYFDALGKPPADRPAFLDAACGPDADLRARVDRLLAAPVDLGGFLDAPAAPKKCRRPSHPPASFFASCMHASCTKAVGWGV